MFLRGSRMRGCWLGMVFSKGVLPGKEASTRLAHCDRGQMAHTSNGVVDGGSRAGSCSSNWANSTSISTGTTKSGGWPGAGVAASRSAGGAISASCGQDWGALNEERGGYATLPLLVKGGTQKWLSARPSASCSDAKNGGASGLLRWGPGGSLNLGASVENLHPIEARR